VAPPEWVRALRPCVTHVDVLGTRNGAAHVVGLEGPGCVPLVLKRYEDGHGERAVRTMRAVRRALAATGGSAALGVPAVHRWHTHANVLAQAAVPGYPLLPLLATARRRAALTHAARALAALHASGARTGPATTMTDHIADLIHPPPEHLARALPGLAPRIRKVAAALRRWQTGSPPATAVPVHRDAHPRQMTLDGSRVWLVDWDLAARGDAALDVANFALYLRTRLANDGEGAAETFLAVYHAHSSNMSERLGPFTACMALRLVCKTWRLRPPGWRARMTALLTLAERSL
jgi:aminoglycoside phosphotransferase (APT) family kinase protein